MLLAPLRKKFRLASDEDGSALVEFAASGILLALVLFGVMDTARALYIDNFVANGAREAVRYAMMRGATWKGTSCAAPGTEECDATADNVTSYLQSVAPAGVSTSANYLTVSTTWPGTTPSGAACSATGVNNSPGCVVRVNVTYSFAYLFPFMPKGALTLASTSAMAISQ